MSSDIRPVLYSTATEPCSSASSVTSRPRTFCSGSRAGSLRRNLASLLTAGDLAQVHEFSAVKRLGPSASGLVDSAHAPPARLRDRRSAQRLDRGGRPRAVRLLPRRQLPGE